MTNRQQCLAAEKIVAQQLEAQGNKVLGSHVGIRTSKGLRVVDHLVQTPDGTIIAIEVKSGNAIRNPAQIAKDQIIATEGGVVVGKNAPAGLSGQPVKIVTVVIQVKGQ